MRGAGEEEEDTESEDHSAPATKKRRLSKKPAAASVTKKAASPSKKLVDAKLAFVKKHLQFPGKKAKPMYCGCITVYVDMHKQNWRVKPGKGRRDEKHVNMGSEPRVAWNLVQLRAAEYLAESTE